MKILMSAFSCCPGFGSEAGVGWNWALEAARQGHQVRVLTQERYAAEITGEPAVKKLAASLSFDFFMPDWLGALRDALLRTGSTGIALHITHMLWQIAAYFHARAHYLDKGYDIIHHITFGGIRHPTLLGRFDVPLVLGPLGGGERAPFVLRKSFSWRGWLTDLVRDAHTWLLRFDPITLTACRDALAIYVKTTQSKHALPRRYHHKIKVHSDIGIDKLPANDRVLPAHKPPLKLIYAGRMLYWKGMGLGLRALAQARARGVEVRLTMVGAGPQEAEWRALGKALGVEDLVDWKGEVPHEEMLRLYWEHDALLFPSLHDSSGNVVLEALRAGLPVVCLELGGPAEIVTPECGCVIAVEGRDENRCVGALAEAIEELATSPKTLARLSRGAQARIEEFPWRDVVGGLYRDVERHLAAAKAGTEREAGASTRQTKAVQT